MKIELPYDPEGIHPKELKEGFLKEFASMFIVALFTLAGASQVALVVKEPACQCRRHKRQGFNPWIGKIPLEEGMATLQLFLPGKAHGQKSLLGYSPWGCKETNTAEQTCT